MDNLEITVEKEENRSSPAIMCGHGDPADGFRDQMKQQGRQAIDFETGAYLRESKVSVRFFVGFGPPLEPDSRWELRAPTNSSEGDYLLACSMTTAYLEPKGPKNPELIRVVTRMFSEFYVVSTWFHISSDSYGRLSKDIHRIIESVSIRCGKTGNEWCPGQEI